MDTVNFTPRIASQLHVRFVDSDIQTCESLSLLFRLEGFQTSFAVGVDRALFGIENPDVFIVNFELKDGLGMTLLRKVRVEMPRVRVFMLTDSPNVGATVLAMKFGAVDVVQKPVDNEHLLTIVRDSLRSDIQVGALVDGERPIAIHGFKQLTPREREVLELIANGKSNKAAANELHISPRTVEIHRSRVMQKLDARNTADLMRIILTR